MATASIHYDQRMFQQMIEAHFGGGGGQSPAHVARRKSPPKSSTTASSKKRKSPHDTFSRATNSGNQNTPRAGDRKPPARKDTPDPQPSGATPNRGTVVKSEPDRDDLPSYAPPVAATLPSGSHADLFRAFNSDDGSVPRNELEARLLHELLAMGFQDRVEILDSIRRLSANSPPTHPPTADTVMIDIITGREEAEEARKMDMARQQSEQTRKAEAKRLREALQQEKIAARRAASWDQWMQEADHYVNSWILGIIRGQVEHAVSKSATLKDSLLDLLELEKKARKWYGHRLPRTYFQKEVAPRLMDCSNLKKDILCCIDTLQKHMFELSEQDGGVPILFLRALERHGDSGDEADDEVVVVRVDRATAVKENSSPAKPKDPPEVIELL